MDVMILVYNERLNLNISCLKLAVSSPGHFAGTIAGIVFIWRLAILVDSLDTLQNCVILCTRASSAFEPRLCERTSSRQTHR